MLYLDVFSKKVEQYNGDYNTVKADIARRIANENAENARLIKAAKAKKDQANKFANKGGSMRKAAQKLKEEAIEMEVLCITSAYRSPLICYLLSSTLPCFRGKSSA